MTMAAEIVVAMGWYTAATWAQLKAIPEARIEMSYPGFVRNFETLVRKFAAEGVKVQKVAIDVDQMVAWCHRNGYAIDTTGRALFGTVAAMAREDPAVMNNSIVDNVTRSWQ